MKSHMLVYPDTNKPLTLFNDTSKYAWSAVLTQEYTTVMVKWPLSPIIYVSELF